MSTTATSFPDAHPLLANHKLLDVHPLPADHNPSFSQALVPPPSDSVQGNPDLKPVAQVGFFKVGQNRNFAMYIVYYTLPYTYIQETSLLETPCRYM
jgi:hypothetical protein